jgi:hypothetical protein
MSTCRARRNARRFLDHAQFDIPQVRLFRPFTTTTDDTPNAYVPCPKSPLFLMPQKTIL